VVYALLFGVNPFYYFYTKSLTIEEYRFTPKELLHFSPLVVFLALSLLTFVPKEPLFFSHSTLNHLASIVYNSQVIVYSLIMVLLLRKHNINLKNYFSFNEDINLNWLKIFIVIYIFTSALDLSIYYSHNASLQLYYYILMIGFFNFLGYFGIRQNNIYIKGNKSLILEEDNEDTKVDNKNNEADSSSPTEQEKALVPDDKKQKLMSDILNLMNEKEIFLNNKLTIFDLSETLGVNKTYISNVINENTQDNFNNFVNKYRVELAKEYIIAPEYKHLTIEAIANMVGFNSKAAFNAAFKKFSGKTPSVYKKEELLNLRA
jgi:AraC-like DNA-binding protein